MSAKIRYLEIDGNSLGFKILAGTLAALLLAGLYAFFQMHDQGHKISGMDNHTSWGLPHVFAIFLIVAASGALNIASIATVFNKAPYKPLARLSAWLAIALLMGGVMVLVLDLGTPEHVWHMIQHANPTSMFAANIVLYPVFLATAAVYLWTMMDYHVYKYYKAVGLFAFVWRLLLTTGTGSIFGFLVGRTSYDAALIAPLFVVLSFAYGLAVFLLCLLAAYRYTGRPLGDALVYRLKNLLGVFVAAAFYLVLVHHLTNLYSAERSGFEKFILSGSSVHTPLFWIGQIFLGTALPLILFYSKLGQSRFWIATGAVLILIGAFAQMYVTVIGGQAFPQQPVPAEYVILNSPFGDANTFHSYTPSAWEVLLGLGGVALAALMVIYGCKLLRFLPESLADKDVDPHFKSASA